MVGFISTILVIAGLIWTLVYAIRGTGEAFAILGVVGTFTIFFLIAGVSTFGFELFALICLIIISFTIYTARNQ